VTAIGETHLQPVEPALPLLHFERAVKWVKRNPLVAGAAAAVLLVLVAGVAVSSWFAYAAGEEAKAARKAEGDARTAETKAEDEAKAARKAEREAKWQARLANDARHAVLIDLALQAREEKDYDRMTVLLKEMRPEYQSVWETCYIRTLWLRENPLRATLKGHTGLVTKVAFSPDGKSVLTGSFDKTARVWDTETGQEKAVLKGHTGPVTSVAFSPDGKRVLTGSQDKTAQVWDAETGQEKVALKGHTGFVTSVAFSLDGKRILTGSQDKTARVWDAETGQEKAVLKGHTGEVISVAFSPDGKRVLTGGGNQSNLQPGEAKVWDAETGQEKAALKGHTDPVVSVAFSPDGKRVLTGSWDNTARVWDADGCASSPPQALQALPGQPANRLHPAAGPARGWTAQEGRPARSRR